MHRRPRRIGRIALPWEHLVQVGFLSTRFPSRTTGSSASPNVQVSEFWIWPQLPTSANFHARLLTNPYIYLFTESVSIVSFFAINWFHRK